MSKASKAIEFKISTVVAFSVLLNSADPKRLAAALVEATGGSADYFAGDFAVIDVRAIKGELGVFAWGELIKLLKSCGLTPVAVRGAPEETHASILRAGLTIDTLAPRELELPVEIALEVVDVQEPEPVAAQPAAATMIVEGPVRTGNRVYARGVDLIVMGSVSPGAEIIADGNVHVYGALRGRALAGASGNANARIFAMSLEAELVSIAGIYRTFDDGSAVAGKGPMQVRLQQERIEVTPLG
jgi:septum site-determining protein MinC